MTEMVKSQSPTNGQANGAPTGRFIDGLDPDDPEYQRRLQRPAEIKEDVKQMENRQRVSFLLKSQAFRDELDEIVKQQLVEGVPVGCNPEAVVALQHLSDLLAPTGHVGKMTTGGLSGFLGGIGPVVQINDLRGPEHSQLPKLEKLIRCKLASLYRVVDLFGWTQNIYNHITARLSPDQEHFFINPFGLLYSEVTAASLVKVDVRGEILDPGCTTLGINKAGFIIHSALHSARPDVRCVLHLHTPSIVAVSVMKCGLLPLCQEAAIIGPISYHQYNGIVVDENERYSLAKDLGPTNKVMFLHNHGVVVCGDSIEETFLLATNIVLACDTQIRLIPLGVDNLIQMSSDAAQKAYETAIQGAGGVGDGTGSGPNKREFKWRRGELEFTSMMRLLDNAGYRTGYLYRAPLVRDGQLSGTTSNGVAEVAIPPTATAATLRYAEEEYAAQNFSPARQSLANQSKGAFSKWLTSPNVYQKIEQEEIGTPNPKKITHWVTDGNTVGEGVMSTSTPIRIDSPHQFAPVPQGTVVSTKELRDRHKKIRQDYYADRTTAGPQSKLLEGTTWEEAQRMIQNEEKDPASTQHVLVGAASKGIIQREFQHNAVVYKSYYAPNPFEKMTDRELAEYQRQVTSGEVQPVSPPPDAQSPQELQSDHQLIVTETVTEVPVKVNSPHIQHKHNPPPERVNITSAYEPEVAPKTPQRPKSRDESMLSDRTTQKTVSKIESSATPVKPVRPQSKVKPGERVTVTQTTVHHVTDDEGKHDGKEGKKKKKFRIPSFSSGRKKEKRDVSSPKDTTV